MIGNSVERYSKVAILLHWLLAFALAAELAIGFGMPHDASGFALFQLHKSIGITILLLSLIRLGWRLTHKTPPKLEKGFNGFLGSAVHVLFYVFMVGAPLTGWAIVSTDSLDVPTYLFGTVPWPHLPIADALNEPAAEVHELLAFFGIGLFVLHIVGALRHHFILKDRLLARMAPGASAGAALALLLGVVGLGAATFAGIGGFGKEDHDADGHEHGDEEGTQTAQDAAGDAAQGAEGEGPDGGDTSGTEDADADEESSSDQTAEDADEQAQSATEAEDVPVAAGPPPSWTIQPGGSLRFTVDNGGTALNGRFRSWSGTIAMNPENPQGSNIAIRIDLGSASMGDATQDEMLSGADFLSVAAFPTATFRSTDVQRTNGNNYRANGTLSLKGVSKPQSITFSLAGSGNRRSVTGSAAIDRGAFSVGTGSNAANLGGNVAVNFTFDAVR